MVFQMYVNNGSLSSEILIRTSDSWQHLTFTLKTFRQCVCYEKYKSRHLFVLFQAVITSSFLLSLISIININNTNTKSSISERRHFTLLVNARLPYISGWEFTKLLRQIRKIFHNFKVLLQSNYSYKISSLCFLQLITLTFIEICFKNHF